jgi:hypothetical protein
MFRFISFMLGRQWEPCKSCENLKEQLIYERDNNMRLTNTLIQIVSPKAVEAPPIEINQVAASSALFSRRRAMLEEKDRQEAAILNQRKHVAIPDNLRVASKTNNITTVEDLEKELGVEEEKEKMN